MAMTLAHAHRIAPPTGTAEGDGLLAGLLATAALIGLATLMGLTLLARGDIADIGLLYLVPVMFAAIRLGLRPGLAAGVLSSLCYNYFFIPPRFTMAVADPSHLITLVILLGVALVGSHMAARLRQQAMLAQAQAGRDALLAGFAGRLMGVIRRDALWTLLASEVAHLFGLRVLVAAPDAQGIVELVAARPAHDRLDLLEAAAAQWCLDSGRSAGPGGLVPTASEWLFLPVPGSHGPLAVVGVGDPDADLPLQGAQAPLLESLLAQTGLALARIGLEEEKLALGRVQERERLRSALLSSIGHDLRTPLTTVLGTLRALRPLDHEQAVALASARSEAERLDRFVANLIEMVRMETGALRREPEPVDLAEACDAALDHLAPAGLARQVDLAVPEDLPLVLADPRLLHHCLINLIDNAARHGGGGAIRVEALADGQGGVELAVCDNGPGVTPGEEERIFGMFTRLEGSDRQGGTGLGLAIVKGFAEAMGLAVTAANRPDGGARFALHVPSALVRAVEA
ncbi:sensor histidine kinase [Novosphingobium rhizosphaerae]|uniref:sensor histidine kinase n=1 Tax=Novosphingobium rhizosphaerae TaxID=1551649 RepID=UPI00183690F6